MMDGNDNLHVDRKVTFTCNDVEKLTDIAKSAGDTFLELAKLLPSPIPVNSKVYETLEAMRCVPIECVAINRADIGIQVDLNHVPETTNEEDKTSDEYEIINIPSDTTRDKSDNIMETKQFEDDATNQCQTIDKLQPSECVITNVESDREIDIDNDTEPTSMCMSSNNNSTLTLGNDSEIEDTVFNASPKHLLDASDEVGIPDALGKQNINETDNDNAIKIDFDTIIVDSTKKVETNLPQSPRIESLEDTEKMATEFNKASSMGESILVLVKPKNYKPKPRSDVKIFGSKEDAVKCLEIASKAMTELNYDKAKRMVEKAERIHPTPEAIALLEQIRIVTEAREEAAKRAKERAIEEAAQKVKDEEIAAKAAAKKSIEKAKKEAAEPAKKSHEKAIKEAASNSNFKGLGSLEVEDSASERQSSGEESLKRNADPVSTTTAKKLRAEGLMSAAQVAFSKGDIAQAEKLAQRANKVNQSEETAKFLEKIRNKALQINAEKKENADPNVTKNASESDVQSVKITSLLNKVKECLTSGRLDDAEQALGDVRDCHPHPTEDVKSLEFKIRAARASRSSTESTQISYPDVRNTYPEGKHSPPEEKSSDPKNGAKIGANNFVGIARNAIAAGDYEKAEKFLNKANALYPCETTVQLLQIEMFSDDAKKLNSKKYSYSDYFAENTEKACNLCNEARKALSKKNFDEAWNLALEGQKFHKLAKLEVLKKDIIKAKKLHESSQKNINTNTLDGNCNKNSRKVNEALSLVVNAKTEIANKNVKKAEQLLIQSIEIHSTESATNLLKELREFERKQDRTPSIRYGPNHYEAQKCLELSKMAAKEKDFKKAEHFLEKSNRMAPSKEAKEMLQNVRVQLCNLGNAQTDLDSEQKSNDGLSTHEVHNNETDSEYLIADVEQCITLAINAISAEDYDKAEKLLKKAERIKPTEKAKVLLEDIQDGLKRKKMCLANEEKAAPLVSLAMETIDKEHYESAEILLMNAWIKHKSETAEKMIKQVRLIAAGKDRIHKTGATQILDEQKEIARECVEIARRLISEQHLESAECVLIIAQNTYARYDACEMLTSVRNQIDFGGSGEHRRLNTKQWKYSKISKEGNKRSDAFKCNIYVQMAQRAYETGYYTVAKEFLLEAEKVVPNNEDISKLIILVDKSIKCIKRTIF